MAKNIDKELLISMVEARPALWDKQSGDFKDKHLKIDCWKAVCLSLNEDFDILEEKQRQEYGKLVQRKWAGLRDTWVRKRKEQNEEKSSGSGAKRTRPYIFDQQMSFLRKIYTESPNVVDSIIIDEDVDSIEKDNTLDDISSGVRNPATERKRKLPVDHKMMKFIDHQMGATSMANEGNQP
ncbi:hypothetical protein M8J77_019743 [Diaphorina citri]|nr:hypothetical protein M8J77_019743 [Diaphorina citri]